MLKKEQEQPDSLLQTIQLTSKLQQSLRRLMTTRQPNQQKSKLEQRSMNETAFQAMQKQIHKLREQNKELYSDNEKVCRDIVFLREQVRQLKKEQAQNKKYIEYLQNYNSDLKKELMFWMRKPTCNEKSVQKEESSVGQLMHEVIKLRKENHQRQAELQSLRKTTETKDISIKQATKVPKKLSLQLNSLSKNTKKSSEKVLKSSKIRLKTHTDCTSCNYQQYAAKKHKKAQSNMSISLKKDKTRNLCECHKRYIETSTFMN